MSRKKKRPSSKTQGPSTPGLPPQTPAKARVPEKYQPILILMLFAAVASVFHLSSPNIPDLDSFYYIRLAWIYRTRGLFGVDFPWIQYSVIKDLSSSLWYGFGIFLVPFTYFNNLVVGIKVAGILLTAGALTIYYLAIKRGRLRMALLWPFLYFFSAANVQYQFLMTRPQLISLALSPLLFSLLTIQPETTNRSESPKATGNFIPVFSTTLGIVWFHLNFAWLAALILGVVVVIRWFIAKRLDWGGITAVTAGALLGWMARPEPVNAARLLYVQLVQQLLQKQSGLSLFLGIENLPLGVATLVGNFLPFMLLWILAILTTVRLVISRPNPQLSDKPVLLWSSLTLSLVFFLFTMLVSRRFYNLWTGFGIIFFAALWTHLTPSLSLRAPKRRRNMATYAILGMLVFMAYDSASKTMVNISRAAFPPDMLRSAALWLKENSQPGEVVFNIHWSDFSPLFFWNQRNYYVGGLDPIFQYAHDPKLYWKYYYLSAGLAADETCGAARCSKEMLEDTHDVLVRDFKAKYVVLDKQGDPLAYDFFENDRRFEKKLETGPYAVYLVK